MLIINIVNTKNILSDTFEYNKYNLYQIFKRSNKIYMKPNNICKKLVIYGSNIENNIGYKKYTSIVTYMVNIPNRILYILTGLILSDGHITFVTKTISNKQGITSLKNSRFYLKQSLNHSEYLLYVFSLLSHYCITLPKTRICYLKGKPFYAIEFYTRALPCLTLLRNKFYNGRVKIIPSDIYDYIDYESIAHMIMSNGSFVRGGGILINLQNFTVKELILLLNVFKIKFNLDCTLHKSKHQYALYIKLESVKILYPKIKQYIVENMRYKFNKNIINNQK